MKSSYGTNHQEVNRQQMEFNSTEFVNQWHWLIQVAQLRIFDILERQGNQLRCQSIQLTSCVTYT